MRTTLIINDRIFTQAKKFALEAGTTLGTLTTQALEDYMRRQDEPKGTEKFIIPVFGGSTPTIHSLKEIAKLRDEGR